MVKCMGPYPWSLKSNVKYVGPYSWKSQSVVRYMGPHPWGLNSVVKYIGPYHWTSKSVSHSPLFLLIAPYSNCSSQISKKFGPRKKCLLQLKLSCGRSFFRLWAARGLPGSFEACIKHGKLQQSRIPAQFCCLEAWTDSTISCSRSFVLSRNVIKCYKLVFLLVFAV